MSTQYNAASRADHNGDSPVVLRASTTHSTATLRRLLICKSALHGQIHRRFAMNGEIRNDRRHHRAACKEIKPRLVCTSRIFEPANGIRPRKATEITDRVDERNAAGGALARKKL